MDDTSAPVVSVPSQNEAVSAEPLPPIIPEVPAVTSEAPAEPPIAAPVDPVVEPVPEPIPATPAPEPGPVAEALPPVVVEEVTPEIQPPAPIMPEKPQEAQPSPEPIPPPIDVSPERLTASEPVAVSKNEAAQISQEPDVLESEIDDSGIIPPNDQAMAASDTPAVVLKLNDEELKAAMKLYLQKHQAERAKHGVAARQAKMQKNLDEVVAYISNHSHSQVPRMSRELNMSPQLLSRYLQKLVKQGRVQASGWQKNRRYFI